MDPTILEMLQGLGFEVTEDLSPLTDEQLTEAEAALQGAYAEARENRDLDRAEQIVAATEAVYTETAARYTAAEELEQRFAELDARVTPTDETAPADDESEGEEAPAEAEPEAQPAEAEAEAEVAEPEREPVAANAVIRTEPRGVANHRRAQEKAARRMPTAPPERQVAPDNKRPAIVAGGDLRDFSVGQEIPDVKALGHVASERIEALMAAKKGNRRMGGRFLIASVKPEWPEERTLNLDNNDTDKINAVLASVEQDAQVITAAGGLCAPVNVSYDLYGLGDDHRPIRDSLVRFNATRGGIRFVAPPALSGMAGAVDVITEAEDTSGPTKPCLTITCGSDTEEFVSAITKCLQVGNWNKIFFREQFDAWWKLAGVQHAREAETELWDRLVAASTAVTTGEVAGAARDILENLDQAAAAYRSRHRMQRNTTLRVIGPDWIPNLIRSDLVRQMAGDSTYAVTDAQINEWLAVRNIAVTWSPDITGNIFGTQGAAPLLRWPDTADFLFFSEGSFLFLDGGSLDFGMEIRDSTLNVTNDVQAMMETFEGEAFVGIESLRIRMNLCPSGEAAALADLAVCTTGS